MQLVDVIAGELREFGSTRRIRPRLGHEPGPPGIPFSEVAPPPEQPDLGTITAPLKSWRGRADVPKIDLAGIVVPPPDLLADNASIRW